MPFLEDFINSSSFVSTFHRGHSTVMQLVRVVILYANRNLCSAGVFLDIRKAFAKVWQEDILYKLIEFPLPDTADHVRRFYGR